MPLITCPVCSSADHRVYDTRHQRRLVSCSSCGFRFVNPMPEPADLQREVGDSKAYSHLPLDSVAHLEELANGILSRIEQRLSSTGRLLDIGCGPGVLLSVARARGWQPQGLELSMDSAERCRAAGFDVITQPLEQARLETGAFDAVVLHHVLEHVPDPNDTIRRCSQLLKPGGVLFIAVPNARSWRARVQGAMNAYVYQRDHLLFFDSVNLKTLVARHVTGPVSVETCRLGGRVGKIAQQWLAGRLLGAVISRAGLGVEIRCWAAKP